MQHSYLQHKQQTNHLTRESIQPSEAGPIDFKSPALEIFLLAEKVLYLILKRPILEPEEEPLLKKERFEELDFEKSSMNI